MKIKFVSFESDIWLCVQILYRFRICVLILILATKTIGCPSSWISLSSHQLCLQGPVYMEASYLAKQVLALPEQIREQFTAISNKVVPEQSGKVEYEREKLAGSDD